jgi:hypothetical protein
MQTFLITCWENQDPAMEFTAHCGGLKQSWYSWGPKAGTAASGQVL